MSAEKLVKNPPSPTVGMTVKIVEAHLSEGTPQRHVGQKVQVMGTVDRTGLLPVRFFDGTVTFYLRQWG